MNSGRSTREHNIEDTALKTNLEASEEIARQLRLRDLAGLIVIDFIDMEEKRNNRSVEKKLNECLKNDRARIQVGRISPFGLLEMSRQRIRTGVLESSSIPCPHCAGTGFVRSTPSVALQVLRSIEETLIKNASYNLVVRTRMEAAFYILNQKRVHLRELETRFGVAISIVADESMHGTTTYAIERGDPALKLEHKSAATGIQIDAIAPVDEPVEEDEVEIEAEAEEEAAEEAQAREERGEEGEGGGRRRRRRRRRRGRDRDSFAGGDQAEMAPRPERPRTNPTRRMPRTRPPARKQLPSRPASRPTRTPVDVAAAVDAAAVVDAVVTRRSSSPWRKASSLPIRPSPRRCPTRQLPLRRPASRPGRGVRPTVTVEDPIVAPARPVAEAPVPPPAPWFPSPSRSPSS